MRDYFAEAALGLALLALGASGSILVEWGRVQERLDSTQVLAQNNSDAAHGAAKALESTGKDIENLKKGVDNVNKRLDERDAKDDERWYQQRARDDRTLQLLGEINGKLSGGNQ